MLFRIARQASGSSLLSGCPDLVVFGFCPPAGDQSVLADVISGRVTSDPDQNHPLVSIGCKSGRWSQPSKSQSLPEVQIHGISFAARAALIMLFSSAVSMETRSMQCLLQMLRASSQSAARRDD